MENNHLKKYMEDKVNFHFKSVLYHLLELKKTSQQLDELFPQKEQQLSDNELKQVIENQLHYLNYYQNL